MSRSRLPVTLALLLLLVGSPFAAFAVDGCADDDCPPSCGDCALCGQVAVVVVSPLPHRPLRSAPPHADVSTTIAAAPVRAVEHVPLPRG